MSPGKDAEVRRKKPDGADRHRRAEMPANDFRIDLGARKKGQKDCSEPGEIIDPGCERHGYDVAGDGANDDLEKRHLDGNPGLQGGREQREPDPQRRGEPNVFHSEPFPAAGCLRRAK